MDDLSQPRFAPSPLAVFAVAISAGIALAHYYPPSSKSVLIVALAIGISLAFFSIALHAGNRTTLAGVFLIAAFLCAGLVLSLIESRPAAPNRISGMYDEGLFAYGEPVELRGVLQGQPEPA